MRNVVLGTILGLMLGLAINCSRTERAATATTMTLAEKPRLAPSVAARVMVAPVPTGATHPADLDLDGDVDCDDAGLFAACYNGSGNRPACAGPTFADVVARASRLDRAAIDAARAQVAAIRVHFPLALYMDLGDPPAVPPVEWFEEIGTPLGRFAFGPTGEHIPGAGLTLRLRPVDE